MIFVCAVLWFASTRKSTIVYPVPSDTAVAFPQRVFLLYATYIIPAACILLNGRASGHVAER